MVVAAAGAVDHDRVVAEVERRFASFDATPPAKPAPATFGKGGSRIIHRDLEQVHLTLALEGVPQTDPALFSAQVFTNILGGGMSSRLFQEVREKRGLCYAIYHLSCRLFGHRILRALHRHRSADAPEMMDVIVDEMNEAAETLTDAEVARAKAQMKAGLLMGLENCSTRAEQMARHILAYGRPLTVEELVARDRGGERREHARRRARAAVRAAAPRWWRSAPSRARQRGRLSRGARGAEAARAAALTALTRVATR